MLDSLPILSLPTMYFVTIASLVCSALCMLHPRIPLHFVRVHVGVCGLPPLIALLNLVTDQTHGTFGLWHLDRLAWLTALFVLTIGLVIQRFSVRYLLGDRNYRKYFALMTLTTGFASIAWLSNDLRCLIVCWGMTLLGLKLLIGLNREWRVARTAAALSGRLFALSWLLLLLAIIWLFQVTGHWQLSLVITKSSLLQLGFWNRTGINLLLVLAVVIPAGQFPFQRWLLDSVVAPTPVSAIMHAGVVNAGGIILTRFAPLFNGSLAQILLITLSSITILIGTGIILVQVDYKRQLVGSTIAQMGFMLIQCALGAYLAAIIHAILHGLFKSALFLQAGSAVHHTDRTTRTTPQSTFFWRIAGGVLSLMVGIGFWLTGNVQPSQLISALLLGWSVWVAWNQLVAFGFGRIGRLLGICVMVSTAVVFYTIPTVFNGLLHGTFQQGIQPPTLWVVWVLFLLLFSSGIGAWLTRHPSSTSFAVLYLWLVRLGEPHRNSIENHPKHLSFSLSQGGNRR